jgi:hypothetical protein
VDVCSVKSILVILAVFALRDLVYECLVLNTSLDYRMVDCIYFVLGLPVSTSECLPSV